MSYTRKIAGFIIMSFLCLNAGNAIACSMFKITGNGRTFVGNNEDSWNLGAKLWFETGVAGKQGAMYVGYHLEVPQGGMNEAGLAYDGFTIPERPLRELKGKHIADAGAFLKQVMQQCTSVDEVRALFSQYDYRIFPDGMLLYVDRTGKYLVVEPDTMIMGNDPAYVLSNFCPSVTPGPDAVKIKRYHRGLNMLQAGAADATAAYCLAMMDTMHECRRRLGDGTLYTNVYDLQERRMHLYFYHDYAHEVSYDLAAELAKGNHVLQIPALFPANKEYEGFLNYKTPLNNAGMLLAAAGSMIVFLFSAIFFLTGAIISALRRSSGRQWLMRLLLAGMNIILLAGCYFIARNKDIVYIGFYPGAPQFSIYKLASFTPALLLILIVPLLWFTYKTWRSVGWRIPGKVVLTIGTLTDMLLLALMAYWGLLPLFN